MFIRLSNGASYFVTDVGLQTHLKETSAEPCKISPVNSMKRDLLQSARVSSFLWYLTHNSIEDLSSFFSLPRLSMNNYLKI